MIAGSISAKVATCKGNRCILATDCANGFVMRLLWTTSPMVVARRVSTKVTAREMDSCNPVRDGARILVRCPRGKLREARVRQGLEGLEERGVGVFARVSRLHVNRRGWSDGRRDWWWRPVRPRCLPTVFAPPLLTDAICVIVNLVSEIKTTLLPATTLALKSTSVAPSLGMRLNFTNESKRHLPTQGGDIP